MNGLELFAVSVIAILTHLLISIVPGHIFQKDKKDMFMLAWLIGIALFVIVVVAWASGVPFRIWGMK